MRTKTERTLYHQHKTVQLWERKRTKQKEHHIISIKQLKYWEGTSTIPEAENSYCYEREKALYSSIKQLKHWKSRRRLQVGSLIAAKQTDPVRVEYRLWFNSLLSFFFLSKNGKAICLYRLYPIPLMFQFSSLWFFSFSNGTPTESEKQHVCDFSVFELT